MDNKAVESNPALAVKIPEKPSEKPRRALTDIEQRWIRETEHRAKTIAMIAMYSGLRRGEIIPLEWSDIDLVAGTITVNKSVVFESNQPKVKEGAKTKAGARVVYVPRVLIDYLNKIADKEGLVCPSADGKMLSDIAFKRLWDSYLAELNFKYGDFSEYKFKNNVKSRFAPEKIPFVIPRFTMHWLRHTFITMMYMAGVDVLTAKEQAGHADIKTTMQIYTHLDKTFKKKSIDKLNDFCYNKIAEINSQNTNGCQMGVKSPANPLK